MSKFYAFFLGLFASAIALFTSAITLTGGKIAFEDADKTALNEGVGNAVSNFWGAFTFVLPYVGVAIGVLLVVGVVFGLVKMRRR